MPDLKEPFKSHLAPDWNSIARRSPCSCSWKRSPLREPVFNSATLTVTVMLMAMIRATVPAQRKPAFGVRWPPLSSSGIYLGLPGSHLKERLRRTTRQEETNQDNPADSDHHHRHPDVGRRFSPSPREFLRLLPLPPDRGSGTPCWRRRERGRLCRPAGGSSASGTVFEPARRDSKI